MTGQPASSELILRTKIRIPGVPPQIVERARLMTRLDESAWQRVTLLCAPAGFGKTTLLAAWARRCTRPVAWLTLDAGDNVLPRFLSYLIAAIQAAFPSTGEGEGPGVGYNAGVGYDAGVGYNARTILEAPQALQPGKVIASLLNDLDALPEGGVLVLDDVHSLQNTDVHNAINELVEHLPATIRLVMASREDPPLPLARLRARRQLSELRGPELRFTREEAAAFLNQTMDLKLGPADVAALEARTEGWIAGLQLAALSMRDRKDVAQFVQAFTGSHRYVLDYLVEEVLLSQPLEVQDFMLYTSILDRLTAPLCDALLHPEMAASVSSQAMLEHLEQSNLFIIALDDERCWYRYHTLFADLLRYRLAQAHPERLPDLHRRAADWLRTAQLRMEAVQHLLVVGDIPEAARVVEEACELLLAAGQGNRVTGGLDVLPPSIFLTDPRLHLVYAWALISTSQFQQAQERLLEAERSIQIAHPSGELPPEARTLLSEIKGTRATLASGAGDLEATIRLSNEALADASLRAAMGPSLYIGLGVAYRLTGQTDQAVEAYRESADLGIAAGQFAVALAALSNLGDLYQEMGQLRQASAAYQEALQVASDNPVNAMAHGGLADLLYQRNQLSAAAESIARALALAESWGNNDILLITTCRQMRILVAQGQAEAAARAMDRIHELAGTGFITAHVSGLQAAFEANYWLNTGQLDLGWQWAQANPPPPTPVTHSETPAIAWATVAVSWALAKGEPSAARRALDILDAYLPALAASGRAGYRIDHLAIRALAHVALGDQAAALSDLDESLALSQPEGYLRLYIEKGPHMLQLLRRALPTNPRAAYIHKILEAATLPAHPEPEPPAPYSTPAPYPTPASATLAEPLSERELEVLSLVAAGLSNRVIATRLVLAEGTVKRHLHNIFEKLAVTSRDEAVDTARRLRLIK